MKTFYKIFWLSLASVCEFRVLFLLDSIDLSIFLTYHIRNPCQRDLLKHMSGRGIHHAQYTQPKHEYFCMVQWFGWKHLEKSNMLAPHRKATQVLLASPQLSPCNKSSRFSFSHGLSPSCFLSRIILAEVSCRGGTRHGKSVISLPLMPGEWRKGEKRPVVSFYMIDHSCCWWHMQSLWSIYLLPLCWGRGRTSPPIFIITFHFKATVAGAREQKFWPSPLSLRISPLKHGFILGTGGGRSYKVSHIFPLHFPLQRVDGYRQHFGCCSDIKNENGERSAPRGNISCTFFSFSPTQDGD